jgi:hypothetical protein
MNSIIIDNVPQKIMKKLWEKSSYRKFKSLIVPKKSKITINWFTEEFEKEIIKFQNDSNNLIYWPFEWDDAIDFLSKIIKWK